MKADPYAYWRSMLAWKAKPDPKLPTPDFDKSHPETGFYRGQRNEAVAIWWTELQQCMARVTRPGRTNRDPLTTRDYDQADQIGDSVFAYCCRNPVEYEVYTEFTKTGLWPEDVQMAPATPAPANDAGTVQERIQTAEHVSNEDVLTSPETVFCRRNLATGRRTLRRGSIPSGARSRNRFMPTNWRITRLLRRALRIGRKPPASPKSDLLMKPSRPSKPDGSRLLTKPTRSSAT